MEGNEYEETSGKEHCEGTSGKECVERNKLKEKVQKNAKRRKFKGESERNRSKGRSGKEVSNRDSFDGGFRRSHIWNVSGSCRDLAGEKLKAKERDIKMANK